MLIARSDLFTLTVPIWTLLCY